MSKRILITAFCLIGLISLINVSCTKDESIDRYKYNAQNDTISPVISIAVPTMNQIYAYGDDVHIVGNITDLEKYEVTNDPINPPKAGSLKSVNILVHNITNGVESLMLDKNPDVTGKDAYTFNEKVVIVTGAGQTDCRLVISTEDGSGKTMSDTVLFQYF